LGFVCSLSRGEVSLLAIGAVGRCNAGRDFTRCESGKRSEAVTIGSFGVWTGY
jgi:hypothetical protein